MALNLSTLTSPATSGDVLAEALTTADFLEPVPVLRNLARGSQKGGDAKQGTALNQPKALPLIKNPQGNLGGYLYIPDVTGNYATGPSVTIGANQTWEAEVDMVITRFQDHIFPLGGGVWNSGFGLMFANNKNVYVFSKGVHGSALSGVVVGQPFTLKYGFDGTNVFCDINAVRKVTQTATGQSGSITHPLQIDQQAGIAHAGNYAIQKAKLTVNSSVVFDCDFNGSTSIRHGDTKFQASVGGPVTINQSGNDPATIIKKPVLRFAGTNSALGGLLNQTIDSGYFFAAFSVLGNGGESTCRVFAINSTGQAGHDSTGFIVSARLSTDDIASYYAGWKTQHDGMFDDTNGDILHEIKFQAGAQRSRANNADERNRTDTMDQISAEEYTIAAASLAGADSANIDLEYLALFPATITDAQADSVRSYINNRNNVFSLIDSQGYYFFDGAATSANQVFTGSSSWPGRIVGSDNDDPFKYLSNPTYNDRPTTDGYKINFADNSDHFLFNTPLTGGQAGWQVVGTSLGTFAYRVNANAVTEINLLGNLGHANTRQSGELYGIILLPESATNADIESARKLLIDRGSSDASSATVLYTFWYQRTDIVDFKNINMSSAVNVQNTWDGCSNMVKFEVTDISNGNNFSNAWKSCSSLQQFPAGAKLGTEANNVNFDNAWNSSGLTSFSTPLPTATSASIAWGYCSALTQFNLDSLPVALNVSQAWRNTGLTSFNTNLPSATSVTYAWYQDTSLSSFGAVDLKSCSDFNSAWRDCSALTSFPSGAKLGTEATNVNFTAAWRDTGLTSFPNDIDLSKGNNFHATWLGNPITSFSTPLPEALDVSYAWYQCSSLSSFSTPVLKSGTLGFSWSGCGSLTDFAEGLFDNWNPSSITSGVFNNTWDGCTSLTAQSVENILTSIDASGTYGTATGASGGGSIDSGIDIDYDGTTLSAATNAAVTSLKAKGWSIIVNNVTL